MTTSSLQNSSPFRHATSNLSVEYQSREQHPQDYFHMEQSSAATADPTSLPPKVRLNGRILNVTFCVPYDVGFNESTSEWDLNLRRGNSALNSSFSYLASGSSGWNQTLVGWTGEITKLDGKDPPDEWEKAYVKDPSTTLSSAPVPTTEKPRRLSSQRDGLRISRANRNALESQLEHQYGSKIYPVWLPSEIDRDEDTAIFKDQARWRKYAEEELYAIFHYQQIEPANGFAAQQAWGDYLNLNKAFAEQLLEIYRPGDIVLIHDFYLLLLPHMLRRRLPKAHIGFYLHIPFPSSEIYRCLSHRKEILEGMLGANVIGFQSHSYSHYFSSCCTLILDHKSSSTGVETQNGHVTIETVPMGIDTVATQKYAFGSSAVREKIDRLRDTYAGKIIIIGRDHLDSAQGVVQKLQAFELFLDRYTQWQGKVVLLQVTSPNHRIASRRDQDKKIINQISELVSRINGSFGSLSFAPVHYFPQTFATEEYYALLRIADIGLITSVRDGINTTGLEYVICQDGNQGPLIISEFSGTAGSLGSAIHINPWDVGGVSDAINHALQLSQEERLKRYKKLYQNVVTLDVRNWTNAFLEKLIINSIPQNYSAITPLLDENRLLSQFRKARKRLFMFDYDGTLTPIVKDPGAAIPSDEVLKTIEALAADQRNAVWIISGRDQVFLDEWMGHVHSLGLSAEHGSFIRFPNAKIWENLAEKMDKSWQEEVMKVFQAYTRSTEGSFIEKKRIALTWHYRRSDPEYGARQAKECQEQLQQTVAQKWAVEIMAGKANLEVRPSFINKGGIAKLLINRYSECTHPLDFILCAGDDYTDEDMFRAIRLSALPLECVFSVLVGDSSKQTLANWRVMEPSDIVSAVITLSKTDESDDESTSLLCRKQKSLE